MEGHILANYKNAANEVVASVKGDMSFVVYHKEYKAGNLTLKDVCTITLAYNLGTYGVDLYYVRNERGTHIGSWDLNPRSTKSTVVFPASIIRNALN